jgi:uncharacterized protein
MTNPDTALEQLTACIKSTASALVALSGGIDSILLSYLAHRTLGRGALSCTVVSEFFIAEERRYIDQFVEKYQISHSYLEVRIIEDERIVSNPSNRCYHCKKIIFETLLRKAQEEGFAAVFDGTNFDDLSDYRPGIRALRELGIVSPFVETGMGKKEILRCARSLGLDNFIRPSNTCLATRIASSVRISEEALAMVEKAESHLHHLGFSVVRVRYHEGGAARIEVLPEELHRLLDTSVHSGIIQHFKEIGFSRVAVDMEGYRRKEGSPSGNPSGMFEQGSDQYASS